MSIYLWILRHIKRNSFHSADPQRISEGRRRQRREFRLYSRILLLIIVLLFMGIPHCTFFFLSAINGFAPPPPYADRICILFVVIGHAVDMLLSLVYTYDVHRIFMAFVKGEHQNIAINRVQCVTSLNMRAQKAQAETTA
jgi:hypothetical protein